MPLYLLVPGMHEAERLYMLETSSSTTAGPYSSSDLDHQHVARLFYAFAFGDTSRHASLPRFPRLSALSASQLKA